MIIYSTLNPIYKEIKQCYCIKRLVIGWKKYLVKLLLYELQYQCIVTVYSFVIMQLKKTGFKEWLTHTSK